MIDAGEIFKIINDIDIFYIIDCVLNSNYEANSRDGLSSKQGHDAH